VVFQTDLPEDTAALRSVVTFQVGAVRPARDPYRRHGHDAELPVTSLAGAA